MPVKLSDFNPVDQRTLVEAWASLPFVAYRRTDRGEILLLALAMKADFIDQTTVRTQWLSTTPLVEIEGLLEAVPEARKRVVSEEVDRYSSAPR